MSLHSREGRCCSGWEEGREGVWRGESSVGTVAHDGIVEGCEDSWWRWLRGLFENGDGKGIGSHVNRGGYEAASEGVIDWIRY